MHRDRFYVPNTGDIRKMVLNEMHDVPYKLLENSSNNKETILLTQDEESFCRIYS